MPSRKGIAENLIAWAIIVAGGWVIHHFAGLATGWTLALVIAGVLLASGLLLRGGTGEGAKQPQPIWSAYYEGGKGGEGSPSGAGGGGGGAAFGGVGGKGGDVLVTTAGSDKPQLVIATERDAAFTKIEKWIKRGEALEESFVKFPTADLVKLMSDDQRKAWVDSIRILSPDQHSRIEEWHRGVIAELRGIGGGALGLYSANEEVGQPALTPNRRFLRERIEELEAIKLRLQPERTERRQQPSPLAEAAAGRPKLLPDVAVIAEREATLLRQKGEQLEEEVWRRWKQIRRSSAPFPMFGAEFHEEVRAWNRKVLALADRVLTAKESAEVAVYPGSSFRTFLGGPAVSEIIQSNLKTLRLIRGRCQS